MDLMTYLMRAAVNEIAEQEDANILSTINEMMWIQDDKTKGNILRHRRPRETIYKVFYWYVEWATTRRRDELHASTWDRDYKPRAAF